MSSIALTRTLELNGGAYATRQEIQSEQQLQETFSAGPKRKDIVRELLLDGYRQAREKGCIEFGEGLSCPKLIRSQGTTQWSFLLPNGEPIRKSRSIGLPQPSLNPLLHSIKYTDEGYWLCFSAENNTGERSQTYVLLSESKSGKEAISGYYSQTAFELKQWYQEAKSKGSIEFGEGLSCPELIGTRGTTQHSLLLPNGEPIGKVKGIGLPQPSHNPLLHSIKYTDEGYWLCFSAENKRGRVPM